jgi:hypothetical protein
VLAQSLRKQGISFEVFERDVDKNARFQGWAIAIHTYVTGLPALENPLGQRHANKRIASLISCSPSFRLICQT